MDSGPVILDVSSDEEGWVETGGGGGGDRDDCYWISEILDEMDRKTDNSDDVVLVGEVMTNPKPKLMEKEMDDDCVILDADPDKPVGIENKSADGDPDDLVIVGEKGQIACRDFPHPRHLCANFVFASTPHEKHCDQCHCYVCDSLAPCIHWGTGTSSNDHCHATDKDDYWKHERKRLKEGDKAPPPAAKLPDYYLPRGPLQPNKAPQTRLQQPNSTTHDQVCKTATIQSCSTTVDHGVVRNQHSVCTVPRNRPNQFVASQHPLRLRNNTFRNTRPHHFIGSRTTFKRPGGAVLTTNQSGYGPYSRNPNFTAVRSVQNPVRWQDSGGISPGSNAYQRPSLPNSGSSTVGSLPLQPLPITGQSYKHSMPSQHQIPSQANRSAPFPNSLPSQPHASCQLNMGDSSLNSVPFQSQKSPQLNVGDSFLSSEPSQSQISSQQNGGTAFLYSVPSSQSAYEPNMGNTLAGSILSQQQPSSQESLGCFFADSLSSLSHLYDSPALPSNDGQQDNQHGNGLIIPDLDPSWISSNSHQMNRQINSDNSPELKNWPTYDPQFPTGSNPGSLKFEADNWLLYESVSSMSPGLNIYSPEPAPLDTGIFFNF